MASTTRIALAACLASGCFAPVGNGADTDTSTGTGTGTGTATGSTPTTGEPSQCTWKNLDISGPPARSEHSMVYDSDNDRIILFGGIADDVDRNDLWTFSVDEQGKSRWQEVKPETDPPPPRRSHAAAYDPIRKIMVVFGGTSGQQGMLLPNDTYHYDPELNTWENRAPMTAPKSRFGASMAYHNGNILLFGGNWDKNSTDSEHWSWNGSEWSLLGNMFPPNRSRHMVAQSPSGNLLLYGGCEFGAICAFNPETVKNDTWSWDGMQWTLLFETAGGGQLGAMALQSKNNKLYRFGEHDTFLWDDGMWSPPQPDDVLSGIFFAVADHSTGLIRFGGNKWDPNTWVLDCPP